MKITREVIGDMFERFVKMIGETLAEHHSQIGAYVMDFDAMCGGYRIEKIHTMHKSVQFPFFEHRLTAKEMYYALEMAVKALEFYQDKQQRGYGK